MRPGVPSDLASLARYILSERCQSIAILTGAGVSCAAGIPDFRSPGGMYDQLRPELITASEEERDLMRMDPSYVVSWDIFRQNQFPYLEVRKPFILGTRERKWKATISHRFAELLHKKTNKLTRIYTQNIDGLDRQCDGIPADKIVNVHGSLSDVACEGCGHKVNLDSFCEELKSNIRDIYGIESDAPETSTPIRCENCGKTLVKPTTVLFGRNLPEAFFDKSQEDLPSVDLLIVAGTSLVVSPANSLVYRVRDDAVRVIINREAVGEELGVEYEDSAAKRDVFAQGNCDEVFLDLIRALGWLSDLEAMADLLPEESRKLLQASNLN